MSWSVPSALGACHIREDNSSSFEELAISWIPVGKVKDKPFIINQHIHANL